MADFGGFTSEFGPGTAPAPPPFTLNPAASPMVLQNFGALSSIYLQSALGTQAAPNPIPANFGIGQLVARGFDGSAYGAYDAALYFRATETHSPAGHGTEVLFYSTPNGSITAANSAGVSQGGSLWCGGPGVLPTNATDGFFGTPAMAGAPTGVPVINYATAPMVFDTADKVLWVYSGGWNPLTPLPTGAAGQVLTGQGVGANPTFTSAAAGSTGPASQNPAAPATTTTTMAGLGAVCSFTPTRNGRVLVMFHGHVTIAAGSPAGAGIFNNMAYGTGTPPANGAAFTGTQAAPSQRAFAGVAVTASDYRPFIIAASLTGLVVGTTYWVDLGQALALAGAPASTQNVVFNYSEQ